MANPTFAAIDVGTTKVCTVVAEVVAAGAAFARDGDKRTDGGVVFTGRPAELKIEIGLRLVDGRMRFHKTAGLGVEVG